MKIKAFFQDYPSFIWEKPFSVEIADACETPTVVPPVIPDQTYFIDDPTLSVTSPPWNYQPTYCPYTLVATITPVDNLNDVTSTFTFTSAIDLYQFVTSNVDLEGNYVVTTEAYTPSGVPTGVTSNFNIEYKNRCELATFTFLPGFISENPI